MQSIGRLYIPETRRDDVATAMRKHDSFIDLKVDEDGTPAIMRMRVGSDVFGEQ